VTTLRQAQLMVTEFNRKHGNKRVTCDYNITAVLRLHLMQEELGEIAEAFFRHDRVSLADGLADLLYVVLGTADLYNINLQEVFREVHRSNMTKEVTGDRRVRTKGKWSKPKIEDVLGEAYD